MQQKKFGCNLPKHIRRKYMKKKLLCAFVALAMVVGLGACSNSSSDSNSDGNTNNNNNNAGGDTLKIGVIQYAAHPSLDNCYEGIKQGLEESSYSGKYTIDFQNGQNSSENCDQYAKNMVAQNYDIIFAIATPAAISAYSAAKDRDIPVIFCAVSDPVEAGLAKSLDAGLDTCNGTADILNLAEQLNMIMAFQPDVKKIGVLYTTTEPNSLSHLKLFKELCSAKSVEVVEQGVSGSADIPQAAADLASKVDCINNFTDNNVVNSLSIVLEKANAAGIPVYGSEVEQVKNGCLASMSIDYVSLGKKTAEMGVKVLDGTKCSELAVAQISDVTPVVNTDVLAQFNITLPDAYKEAEQVTTNS
ncbi:MAG: ABC transporter substrate-binding protein [Oscillospiraceae bacterium]|nr:ABC transporter substrate-binding protein [Oscillospiraceae bacterium]